MSGKSISLHKQKGGRPLKKKNNVHSGNAAKETRVGSKNYAPLPQGGERKNSSVKSLVLALGRRERTEQGGMKKRFS